MKWLRLYDDLVDDPKVQRLSDMMFRAVINLWCITSQNGGKLPPIEDIAFKLRLPVPKAKRIVADLRAAGLIDEDEHGNLVPHNWNGRQYKSDAPSTDRVKRFRERSKPPNSNSDETFHETTKKRPQSQKQNQSQNRGEIQQHSPDSVPRESASGGLISPEAFAISDDLGQAAGFTKENWPVGWAGAAYTIQKFLTDGCPGEVIKLAVKSVLDRRKRDGPPENFSYFAKPIAAAFADFQRPNPVAAPQAFDGKTNGHASRKPTVIQAADALIADIDARIAAAEAREAGERTGEDFARLLPPQRRD